MHTFKFFLFVIVLGLTVSSVFSSKKLHFQNLQGFLDWYFVGIYASITQRCLKLHLTLNAMCFCFFLKSPVTMISTALARNVAPITNVVSSTASAITITMTMTTMMISRKMPQIGLRISKPNEIFFSRPFSIHLHTLHQKNS